MMTVAVGNRCLVAMVVIVVVVAVLVDAVDDKYYCHTFDYGHRLPNPNCCHYHRSSSNIRTLSNRNIVADCYWNMMSMAIMTGYCCYYYYGDCCCS